MRGKTDDAIGGTQENGFPFPYLGGKTMPSFYYLLRIHLPALSPKSVIAWI